MYLITFYNDYKKICTCIKEALNEDEAMLKGEFALICKYPNIKFNRTEATKIN